ncbi:hypothetical protein [Actinomycetospora aeridis]|uniref:Uncharacterized protein n=1 Tax=Actinomycetospora aeridis TaxID=3129231 RepID=A0ABU8N148_9PSEU
MTSGETVRDIVEERQRVLGELAADQLGRPPQPMPVVEISRRIKERGGSVAHTTILRWMSGHAGRAKGPQLWAFASATAAHDQTADQIYARIRAAMGAPGGGERRALPEDVLDGLTREDWLMVEQLARHLARRNVTPDDIAERDETPGGGQQ